jgi:hypothetical protein
MNKKNDNIKSSWKNCWQALWPLRWWRDGEVSVLPRFVETKRKMPRFVRGCNVTMELIEKLKWLDWEVLKQPPSRNWYGAAPVPLCAYVGAYLVKLDEQLPTFGHLRRYLVNHPALVWALGFPLHGYDSERVYGFDPDECVPSRRHLSRVLREMDNDHLQKMLDKQVVQLKAWFPDSFGETVSLDTKHIVAWVKENNPKAYIKEGRIDKTKQPDGDTDCKLGCKRRHNKVVPTKEGKGASQVVSIGEFYWGYASGIIVTKIPEYGEFVLAELTQTFDKGDTTYFFPLMADTERRLGFRPKYGAFDAAFDAFYVYDHFHSAEHDGFAAVPYSGRGGAQREFDADGLPLCEAKLGMPIKSTLMDRTKAIIPFQRARHVCPLVYPTPNGQTCPINHKKWADGGCKTSIANTRGARIRHQLDRERDLYKSVFKQRTATERINSQAFNLGIERPKLRNQHAIINQNTLIYLLINLRTMQRVHHKLTEANR